MNREIKFKAWDTDKKMFVPQGYIIFSDYGDTRIEVNPNCIEYIGDNCHNGEPQRSRFIIVQFTGLKDKNGREIYEGDILKDTTDGDVISVGWSEKYASFCLNKDEWVFSHYFEEAIHAKDCEIIGNIYENPDLLK